MRLRSYLLNLVKSMTISVMSAMTAKMPSIPCHRIVRAASRAVIFSSSLLQELRHEVEDHAAREDACDLPGDVRTHRVHQQMVLRIGLKPHLLDDARGHRERRNACRADHRVDLLLAEQVEELREHHARDGVEHERHEAKAHDDERIPVHELVGAHGERDRDAEQQRDEVRQRVLRGLGETVKAAALAQEGTEHQEADERDGHRRDEARDDGHEDWEADAQRARDVLGVVGHPDAALFFRRHELDGEGLDDRHKRHVRVCRDGDGADVARVQHLRDENGGRAVRRADDADGGGVREVEAEQDGSDHGEEDAELRRRAEEQHLGI